MGVSPRNSSPHITESVRSARYSQDQTKRSVMAKDSPDQTKIHKYFKRISKGDRKTSVDDEKLCNGTEKLCKKITSFCTSLREKSKEMQHFFIKSLEGFSANYRMVLCEIHSDSYYYCSYTQRGFFVALYYYIVSHFEYVVFMCMIAAILNSAGLSSLVYAGSLFFWGLLSIPWSSKRFCVFLLSYTMVVLLMKYVACFLNSVIPDVGNFFFISPDVGLRGVIAWLLGIKPDTTNYFSNAIFNILLLMAIEFQRIIMKEYGLWKNTVTFYKDRKVTIWRQTAKNIKAFFNDMKTPDMIAGVRLDYYVPMLICDILCFLTIVFFYSYFAIIRRRRGDVIQLDDFIQTNNIPFPYLVLLLLQFISMLIDRAIYIRQSLKARIAHYFLLVIGWHLWLLIITPFITERPFAENPPAQIIYLCKSGYFIFSALQLLSGYPKRQVGYFTAIETSWITRILFKGYRLIPLLPELRQVVDWVATDTSLSLLNWMIVQELWAHLFQVKVQRECGSQPMSMKKEANSGQFTILKIIKGLVLLVILLSLIWGPFVVMSFINQTTLSAPPTHASVHLSIEGFELLQIQAQSSFIYELDSEQYNTIISKVTSSPVRRQFSSLYPANEFRRILFPGNSSVLWPATDSFQDQLVSILSRKNASLSLTFSWSFTRSSNAGFVSEIVKGSYVTEITNSSILDEFQCNLKLPRGSCSAVIELNNLYPLFVYAPTTSVSTEFQELSDYILDSKVNCTSSLEFINDKENYTLHEWWTLTEPTDQHLLPSNDPLQQFNGALEMIVFSEPGTPHILNFVSSFGITGLYLSVVLVISQFIRNYIHSLPQKIIIDEMENPDDLLALCNGIFAIQGHKQDNKYEIENKFVAELFSIFRSGPMLIELTKIKMINSHPSFNFNL